MARRFHLAVMLTMFSISTAHLVIHLLWYLIQWPYICATVAPDGYYARLDRMYEAIELLGRAQYLISDVVVVWRAWVIWHGNWWVRGSLLFCLLATAGTSTGYALDHLRLTDYLIRPCCSDINIPRSSQHFGLQARSSISNARAEHAWDVWAPLHEFWCDVLHRPQGLVSRSPSRRLRRG